MIEKNLDYYIHLPYAVRIYPESGGYTAEIPDLPGCLTCADTLSELWEMVEDAKLTWLEGSLAAGLPIPEPSLPPLKEPSNELILWLPRPLHQQLIERASRKGISLNQFVNIALSENIGLQVS